MDSPGSLKGGSKRDDEKKKEKKKLGTQQVVSEVSEEGEEALLPGNQALEPFPGCLHINEHPRFSTKLRLTFPPNLLPPSPVVTSHLGSSACLSTAQLKPWGQQPTLDNLTQGTVFLPREA